MDKFKSSWPVFFFPKVSVDIDKEQIVYFMPINQCILTKQKDAVFPEYIERGWILSKVLLQCLLADIDTTVGGIFHD